MTSNDKVYNSQTTQLPPRIIESTEVDQLKHDINALINAGFTLGCTSRDNARVRQEAWSTVINLQKRYT